MRMFITRLLTVSGTSCSLMYKASLHMLFYRTVPHSLQVKVLYLRTAACAYLIPKHIRSFCHFWQIFCMLIFSTGVPATLVIGIKAKLKLTSIARSTSATPFVVHFSWNQAIQTVHWIPCIVIPFVTDLIRFPLVLVMCI